MSHRQTSPKTLFILTDSDSDINRSENSDSDINRSDDMGKLVPIYQKFSPKKYVFLGTPIWSKCDFSYGEACVAARVSLKIRNLQHKTFCLPRTANNIPHELQRSNALRGS